MVTPGDATAAVTWNQPSPTCSEAIRSTSIAPTGTKQGQLFSIGQHTIVYTYNINEKLNVRCPVMFEVRGKTFNESRLLRIPAEGPSSEISKGTNSRQRTFPRNVEFDFIA